VLAAFAPLFTEPSWARAQALLCGVLLAPANQTLTAALRALGLADEPGFQNYHRVLNRARWSARQAAHHLLKLLVEAFVPAGPVIIGLDDTVERRRGRKLTARAIYYDAARSSRSCFQKRERVALDEPGLAGAGPLGGPGLGAALPDGAVSFGTLRPLRAPRPAAQAARPSAPAASSVKCALGCPIGCWSWWPIVVTPPWSCWPGARGRLSP
jgi:DDE superfamily endonuclease